MKKFSIFISSTLEDLTKERQQAMNAIVSAGHFPVAMESFTAGDELPLEHIMKYMDDIDILLLILGGRYGSVEKKTRKSFTQLEYEYAKMLKKPIVPLVLQDDYLKTKEPDSNIEKNQSVKSYKNFKNLIARDHSSKPIHCLEDIWREVTNAIHSFEKDKDIGGWQRIHSKADKLSRIGITDIYHSEAELGIERERPNFTGAKTIKLLFASGTKFFRELITPLQAALSDGACIQILLATADSEFVNEIVSMQQSPFAGSGTFNDINREIGEAIKTLESLCKDLPEAQLYLGHFNTQYRGNIIIIDDKVAFYNPVLAPRPSSTLLTMKAEKYVMDDCIAHFDTLYKILNEQRKVRLLTDTTSQGEKNTTIQDERHTRSLTQDILALPQAPMIALRDDLIPLDTHLKNVKHDLFISGVTLSAAMGSRMTAIKELGKKGLSVRLLYVNPKKKALLQTYKDLRGSKRDETGLTKIQIAEYSVCENIEMRFTDSLIPVFFIAGDLDTTEGFIQASHAFYDTKASERPTVYVTQTTREWYERYRAQIELIWKDAKPFTPNKKKSPL